MDVRLLYALPRTAKPVETAEVPLLLVQVCCMHLFPHLHTLMISQQVSDLSAGV